MESAKKSYPLMGDVWIGQFDITRDKRHATNMHPSTPLCLHRVMLSAIRQVCHSKGPGTIAVWDKKNHPQKILCDDKICEDPPAFQGKLGVLPPGN